MGKGKSIAVLDKLFEEQGGPGFMRNAREIIDDDDDVQMEKVPWTEELENLLIFAVEKYRKFGYSVTTTYDLIRKDPAFKAYFKGRAVTSLSIMFKKLVSNEKTTTIVPNNSLVDELFAVGAIVDHTQSIGDLFEKLVDLGSQKFSKDALSGFILAMKAAVREKLKLYKN